MQINKRHILTLSVKTLYHILYQIPPEMHRTDHTFRQRNGQILSESSGVCVSPVEKELRKLVNRLRREGVPIASGREGYYYASNAGEVYATIRSLRKMASGLEAAISGLESALEQFSGDDV